MTKHKYPIEEIYKSIGENENLRKDIDDFRKKYFDDHDSFAQWWYDPHNKGLGKSPDEFCKEGRQKDLEKMLMDILHAAHGG
ncbi:MAG: hypothetical protein AABX31_02785 [Nanoarchaeota archaeon]